MSIKKLAQCDETICREVNEVNECLGNMMDTIEQVADEDVKLQLMKDWDELFTSTLTMRQAYDEGIHELGKTDAINMFITGFSGVFIGNILRKIF